MTDDQVAVTLVNVSQTKPQRLIVQTGGYAEHQCLAVEADGKRVKVGDSSFEVRLAPGCGARLIIESDRYVNDPTFTFPWDRP